MPLVLVCIVGHTPLRPWRPVHWPPSIGACSKSVDSNPCDKSQRAAASPPGPAPITATLPAIGELSHAAEGLRLVSPRSVRVFGYARPSRCLGSEVPRAQGGATWPG